MDQREFGDQAALRDAEWRNRVRAAARADVRAMMRSARRRRVERWLVTSMVLIAVIAVLMLMVRVGLFDKVLADSGAPADGEPTVSAGYAFDPAKPFAQTPAEGWADGAAGITVPPAMQVGEFTAEQVADITAKVRDALIASRLDRTLLVGHDPSRYLGMLAPDIRKELQPLFGTGGEPRAQALVSLIADGNPLLPVEPKVTGKMTASAGGPGELVVKTNYVFAYAFEAPNANDPMDAVVVVRAEVDYVWRSGGWRWTESSQGLWYAGVGGYGYAISCEAYKRGFLAPAFRDKTIVHKTPGRDRDSYFDPSSDLPAESGCPA
ncbi:hypothetical protein [Actinokineospora sp. HUAS TT18]|uniref:hypothetical protein n=1 Tax=Actinokineospora sp. HUAS TT18 TaxID=3447451 RepID=UPI003F51D0FB